jgi:hypothetical protein
MKLIDTCALEEAWHVIALYTSDEYFLPLFEVLFLVLMIYAYIRGKRERLDNPVVSGVNRGEESRSFFHITFALSSVIVLQIVNAGEVWKHHKILVGVLDLLLLMNLCFYNRWFRNKVVGFGGQWRQRAE